MIDTTAARYIYLDNSFTNNNNKGHHIMLPTVHLLLAEHTLFLRCRSSHFHLYDCSAKLLPFSLRCARNSYPCHPACLTQSNQYTRLRFTNDIIRSPSWYCWPITRRSVHPVRSTSLGLSSFRRTTLHRTKILQRNCSVLGHDITLQQTPLHSCLRL